MDAFEGWAIACGGNRPRKRVLVTDGVDELSVGVSESERFAAVLEFAGKRSEWLESELFLKGGWVGGDDCEAVGQEGVSVWELVFFEGPV